MQDVIQTRSMKAAILVAQNKPLAIETVELPERLTYGQVLVTIAYSGICGSQIGEITGVKGEDKYLPHLLGHEGSGKVLQVGPDVTKVQKGDHVVLHWKKGTGIEAQPPQYLWKGKRLNAGWITTFNEYAIISENRLTAIPEEFDLELAALMGCAVTTGLGVVHNDAKVKPGESLVVLGSGGVGLSVLQGAKMVSAYPIIAVDRYDDKLELSKRMGATHTINADKEDVRESILRIVGRQGPDVIVDNTGNTSMIALAYETTHSQGRVILVGVPKAGDKTELYSLPLHFGKVLKGSHGGATVPERDIPRYITLTKVGILDLKGMVTDKYTLSEINTALEELKGGKVAGRCLLDMSLPA